MNIWKGETLLRKTWTLRVFLGKWWKFIGKLIGEGNSKLGELKSWEFYPWNTWKSILILGKDWKTLFESLKKITFSMGKLWKNLSLENRFWKILRVSWEIDFLRMKFSWENLEKINDFMMQMTWVNECTLKRFSKRFVGKCALSQINPSHILTVAMNMFRI